MSLRQHIKLLLSWLASVYLLAFGTTVQAAELALSDTPLFLGTQIDPDVFFMMDDSGSMDWEILTKPYHYGQDYWSSFATRGLQNDGLFIVNAPTGNCTGTSTHYYIYSGDVNTDNVYDTTCARDSLEDHPSAYDTDWRIRSSDLNTMYYNPAATYIPWIGFNNASFSNVRSNPEPTSAGYAITRALNGFKYDVWIDDHGAVIDAQGEVEGPQTITDTPNGLVDLWDSHVTYTVDNGPVTWERLTVPAAAVVKALGTDCDAADATATPQYFDCFGTIRTTGTLNGSDTDPWGRTPSQIRQNVANWYEFYRKRSFVAKAAVSRVVDANNEFKFGYSQINDYATIFVEVPGAGVTDYSAHNAAMLNEMYEYDWRALGTPLRRGLERVGRYYDNYYAEYTDPITSSCQQTYAVLFTDGYYSGLAALNNAIGDEDGDGVTDTLADIAHYYYNQDLSPLPDQVPTTPIDPNDEQHMVTFGVAFGVTGFLVDTDNDGYPNPELAENGDWTSGAINLEPEKIDDLWHATFNSKGFFVSAQDPAGVAAAIGAALLEIADRVGSAASVATNTGSLNAGSKLFQARFDSADWKGQLLAFQINLDGTINNTPSWDAGSVINAQSYDTGREIITWNPAVDLPAGGAIEGAGIPFRPPADYQSPNAFTELSTPQLQALMTGAPYIFGTGDATQAAENQDYVEDVINFLRGDDSNEQINRGFRLRNSALGDIVNSDPKFVGAPNQRYPDALESKSYAAFKTKYDSRQGVVWVGANDGMIHGFNDATGAEMLAYVPAGVYDNLEGLTDTNYIHKYYVDGGPNIIDVYLPNMNDPDSASNGLWRTVLASGLAGGGQSVFALDVTQPTLFDEGNADGLVLWEFDDVDDADLGYTYGKVQMAKMNDGSWAAVFGNGYNNTEADGNASTTGNAVLYIVDVETGDLIKKIDTLAGSATTPNGLGTPVLIDENQDFIADYIYAGDLLGNLWKFDVTDSNPASWAPAWSSGGSPAPLFTTTANQPITSQPQASLHPDNLGGFMIFFGTGKYIEVGDNLNTGQTTQTFYGIWDKNTATVPSISPSTDLLVQSITNQYSEAFDTDGDGIDDDTFLLRDVSDNLINWDSHLGWKMDLIPDNIEGAPNASNYGERQVTQAIVRNGRVIFTTLLPSEVECDFGGTSFVMELDFRDGSALEFPAFDLNGDGEYDADDTDASGRASDVGIMPTVSILADDAQDVAFGSGASGDIDVIQLSVGDQAYGRQSWRQLE